jgi:hypothetical protein
MRNLRAHKGAYIILAAALSCLSSAAIFADGEPTAIPTNYSEGKTVEDLGLGNYSRFPVQISASVRAGYDDNITTSHSDQQESGFTNGSVALTYDFGSPRTQLSLQVGGGVTAYWNDVDQDIAGDSIFDQNVDYNAYAGFSLKHKFTPRLSLLVTTYLTYQTEPDFTLAMGLNRRSGNFFYTQDKFTLVYLWTPRFSTASSYTFGSIWYDDNNIGFFEDRFENTFGTEYRFLLWPTTTLVLETRTMFVNYDHDGDPSGPTVLVFNPVPHFFTPRLERDSVTYFFLGGFDHNFNARLSLSVRGGAEYRDYEDSAEDAQDQTSPYFEGTLNYALGQNTSVAWTLRYSIEEPDVLLNPSRDTFRTGVQVRHKFTPRISANAAAYYQHDDYDGVNVPGRFSPSFMEDSFDAAVSARYGVNRWFGIEVGYNHTEVWSDIPDREYSRNRVWGGLNFLF